VNLFNLNLKLRWQTSTMVVASALALGSFLVGEPKPEEPKVGQAATATVVAPNLMVIMGNGYSMNREMDDKNYPDRPGLEPLPFVSLSNPAVDAGLHWEKTRYGDQPTSKFALAKQAMTELLNDDSLSANVNVGFATWRTAFAQPVWAAQTNFQFWGFQPFLNDFNVINLPTPLRYGYASNPTNFKALRLDMNPVAPNSNCPALGTNANTAARGANEFAIVGNNLCDGGREVIKESSADYFVANTGVGGIPRHVVPNHLGGYWDIWSNPVGAGISQNAFPAPDNYQSLAGAIFYRADMPPNAMHFCSSYYSSEANTFGTAYLMDYAVPSGRYPYLHDFRDGPYDANNKKGTPGGTLSCSGVSVPDTSSTELIATQVRDPSGALFTPQESFIPSFYIYLGSIGESVPPGSLSGWSGEAVLTDGASPSEVMTVTYPAGPASTEHPSAPGRQLRSKGLFKNGVTHMGTFLDLPDPSLGYVDQRQIVRGFMLPKQMDGSGQEYDPITQTIAANAAGQSTKGIRTSDSGSDNQSPVYDSLFAAYGYYTAYKNVDPNNACRSNHVLLLYDGRENSRYYPDPSAPGGIRWADPAEMSKKLYDEAGVTTHVIIISGISGDIEEANRIAQSGGSNKAYVIGDYAQLQAALRAVFTDLQAKIVRNPPAVPVYVRAGDAAYTAVNFSNPFYGTLEARSVTTTGAVSATAIWDTNERMTTAIRTANLYSNNGGVLTPFRDLPDAAFAIATGSSLTAATVKSFTIDPSYGSGVYLAGRKSGALQGKMSSVQPLVAEQIASPDLALTPGYLAYARALGDGHKLVLFTADDGFLYAVSSNSVSSAGTLQWGWMPAAIVDRLKNFNAFVGQRVMDGDIRLVDVENGAGGFERLVLGTVDKGKIHFALALSASGALSRLVFEDFHPTEASDTSVAPQIVRVGSATKALYLRGNTLRVVNLGTGATDSISLATLSPSGLLSALHVHESSAFIGTGEGRVFELALATMTLVGEVGSVPTTAGTAPNDRVMSLTSAVVENVHYLVGQSTTRMTIFARAYGVAPGSPFARKWSTFNGGSEGVGVSAIPPSGRFSAKISIVEGTIFAPVTVDGSSRRDSCLPSTAELYFFNLGDGKFPLGAIVNKETGSVVTSNLVIGAGESLGVTLTQFDGGDFGVYAAAQAAGSSGGSSGSTPFTVRAPNTRVVWWKEIERDNY
jgi:hypothetical protein